MKIPKRLVVMMVAVFALCVGLMVWMLLFPDHFAIKQPGQCGVGDEEELQVDTGIYEYGSQEGKRLFMENCARCHSPQLEKEGTGPALYRMSSRIPRRGLVL